ncbi:MAG: AbrB/MazE/SpoVT family DNA-binding domain-containing protein [archaeon]
MQLFEATPKQWGNSLGITIPKDLLNKENISEKKGARFIIFGDQNK